MTAPRAWLPALTLLLVVPSLTVAREGCRAAYRQGELEDHLIMAFEALPEPESATSSHCVFQLDLPGMDVPETGADMGHCRWQGVEGETAFRLHPDQPDHVIVIRGGETQTVLDLCAL